MIGPFNPWVLVPRVGPLSIIEISGGSLEEDTFEMQIEGV